VPVIEAGTDLATFNMSTSVMAVPFGFWTPTPIAPQAALASLRELVLSRSERRVPKWKFRLASDLVLQIQPKLAHKLLHKFECRAVASAVADLTLLTSTYKERKNAPDYWYITFDLNAAEQSSWRFKPRSCQCKRDADPAGTVDLRARLVGAFDDRRFDRLRPEMMLGHHCLACGKGLTDPVSMARGIGPECWGSASADMPLLLNMLPNAEQALAGSSP